MASSDVDICNLALANLGDKAQVTDINPPDGSIQAAQCGRFYPIARNALLEMHPWTFATRRVTLALQVTTPPSEWLYAYQLPADCLKPRAVYTPDDLQDGRGWDYIVESDGDGNRVLYTNVEDAILRYTRLVQDPTQYTPGFVSALARLLASYLAGPIIKGTAGIQVSQAQLKWFQIEFGNARAADANSTQRSEYRDRIPDMVKARGIPPYSGYGPYYGWRR